MTGEGRLLVVVDAQEAFQVPGPWQVPGMGELVPRWRALAERFGPERSLFTRFVPPRRPRGSWRGYYRRWPEYRSPDRAIWRLVPSLEGLGRDWPKEGYSAFSAPGFMGLLRRLGARELVVCGVETDVCVLATVHGAVDRGVPVWLVEDAVASGSPEAHAAALTVMGRLGDQIRLTRTAQWLEGRAPDWPS
jgi:nicotinamidase-related amidase